MWMAMFYLSSVHLDWTHLDSFNVKPILQLVPLSLLNSPSFSVPGVCETTCPVLSLERCEREWKTTDLEACVIVCLLIGGSDSVTGGFPPPLHVLSRVLLDQQQSAHAGATLVASILSSSQDECNELGRGFPVPAGSFIAGGRCRRCVVSRSPCMLWLCSWYI